MGLEDVIRPNGIKGQCLSSHSRFLLLLRDSIPQLRRRASKSTRCHEFRGGVFVDCSTSNKGGPHCGAYCRVFGINSVLRIADSPPSLYVSHLCLVPSSSANSRSRGTLLSALVGRDIHERRALRCCEQQVSRAPWIAGRPPSFCSASIPPPLHCTGMLGVSLNNIGGMEILKTDLRWAIIHGERDRPSREKNGTIINHDYQRQLRTCCTRELFQLAAGSPKRRDI